MRPTRQRMRAGRSVVRCAQVFSSRRPARATGSHWWDGDGDNDNGDSNNGGTRCALTASPSEPLARLPDCPLLHLSAPPQRRRTSRLLCSSSLLLRCPRSHPVLMLSLPLPRAPAPDSPRSRNRSHSRPHSPTRTSTLASLSCVARWRQGAQGYDYSTGAAACRGHACFAHSVRIGKHLWLWQAPLPFRFGSGGAPAAAFVSESDVFISNFTILQPFFYGASGEGHGM